MKRMYKSKKRFIFFPILAVACLFLVSLLVMLLWNYTMPALFALPVLTFWQAMGLFLLSKLLFGFGGGGPKRGPCRQRHGHFKDLNDAQKEKIRSYMHRKRCHWNDETDTNL